MKKSLSIFSVVMLLVLTCLSASAADITKMPNEGSDTVYIRISGEIVDGDDKKFRDLVVPIEDAIIFLNSDGGLIRPALEIGKTIHIKGFSTAVINTNQCASSCALAWLAGHTRFLSKRADVGFHAAYRISEGGAKLESGDANAIIGAYLNNLGFNQQVVRYVTTAPPDEIRWLSKAQADKMGLHISMLSGNEKAHENFSLALKKRTESPEAPDQARILYRLSANEGYAGAQNNLGDMYESGEGAIKNENFAIYWYTRAAERGEPTAYLSLSTLLSHATQDQSVLSEALKFAYLAYAQLPAGTNRKAATAAIKKIESMVPEQVKQTARELAHAWEPLYQEKYLMGDTSNAK